MAGEGQLARPVRVGLEEQEQSFEERPNVISGVTTIKPHFLDERSHGKSVRQHVKEFGALFGIISLAVLGFCIHKQVNLFWTGVSLMSAVFFIGTGYLAPLVLHPVWKAWMAFAHVLGMVMTFLILSICWTVMLAPMALLLKVIGKAVMDTSFDRSVETYWVERDQKKADFKYLENQY